MTSQSPQLCESRVCILKNLWNLKSMPFSVTSVCLVCVCVCVWERELGGEWNVCVGTQFMMDEKIKSSFPFFFHSTGKGFMCSTSCFLVLCWYWVTKSCLTLCNPMDCSTPGSPVLHYLPKFAQIHVHWVGDTILPSHPWLSSSPFAFNLSQHQSLLQWVSSPHQVAKVL